VQGAYTLASGVKAKCLMS